MPRVKPGKPYFFRLQVQRQNQTEIELEMRLRSKKVERSMIGCHEGVSGLTTEL